MIKLKFKLMKSIKLLNKKKYIKVFTLFVFKKIYSFYISKQIIINENRVLLIPLINQNQC